MVYNLCLEVVVLRYMQSEAEPIQCPCTCHVQSTVSVEAVAQTVFCVHLRRG